MAVPNDRIVLRNMVFYGYHGVFPAEKELGQRFEVDVELAGDLSTAAQADDLDAGGINYVDVYTLVKDIVEEREFNLIEALAETIAQEILSAHDVDEVTVRVRKPDVAMGGVLDYVEVEIVRRPER
ncbi:MAG: dihydroneopterin aldolase [Clostridia bacterium]